MDARCWDQCFLCQNVDTNKLIDPRKNTSLARDPDLLLTSYIHTLENIIHMKNLNALPNKFPLQDVDVDNGNINDIAVWMKNNGAQWHKQCKSAINSGKIKRTMKRHAESSNTSPVKTRRMINFDKTLKRPGSMNDSMNDSTCEYDDIDMNSSISEGNDELCFFCDQPGGKKLKAATFHIDAKVNKCAKKIGDKTLLAKLSAGDMIAIDAVYHLLCLAKLYKQAKSVENYDNDPPITGMLKAQAFSELVNFIESYRGTSTVFIMADLVNLYSSRLISLGLDIPRQHSTRLRQSLLRAIPDLKEVQCVVNNRMDLAFDADISMALM